jgi:hypothetical protein
MKRVVPALALALILVACGSWFPDSVHPVHLVAGSPADAGSSLFLGGDRDDPCKFWSSAQGLLVTDPRFGTAIMDNNVTGTVPVPVVWPPNFTGAVSGSEVEVLDPQGNVVAVTGNEYHISGGPVADREPDPRPVTHFLLSWPGLGVPAAFWACGRVTRQG